MCELISPSQLLFSQKYLLNIFFLLLFSQNYFQNLFPQVFGGDFLYCSFPKIFQNIFSPQAFGGDFLCCSFAGCVSFSSQRWARTCRQAET